MTDFDALYATDALPDGTVDAVVIGGGAAGLNGALMLARSRRTVVVLDNGAPRNAPAEAMHGFIVLDGMAPAEILARGREQVRDYGGHVVRATVASTARITDHTADPLFTVTLSDGGEVTARRILVATGLRDQLPDIPGLREHWGRGVVHCPYCHGWEVRDEPIGVIATGPGSLHHALLFRQLTEDLVYFTGDTALDDENRKRFTARGIRIIDTPVKEVVTAEDGTISGVTLTDDTVVERRILAVAGRLEVRADGLDGLGLTTEEMPEGIGVRFVSGMAGTTDVPGVWVAGNATDPMAQVGSAGAAGALAGAHINAHLAAADTDAAWAAASDNAVSTVTG